MNIPGELIPIVLFICAAAVMILAPISFKLGKLLEAMARDRQRPNTDGTELAHIRTLIEHLSQRVDLMEERMEFTERLVDNARRPGVGPAIDRESVGLTSVPTDSTERAQSSR